MKRKLALLLAGVMTMSMLPMNLFAASTNYLGNNVIGNVEDDTVMVEPSVATVAGTNRIEGSYLVISPTTDLPTGDAFVLELTNADWDFGVTTTAGMALADVANMITSAHEAVTAVSRDLIQVVDVNLATDAGAFAAAGTGSSNYVPASGKWIQAVSAGALMGNTGVYVRGSVGAVPDYILGVASGNKARATVVLTKEFKVGTPVRIPLALIVDDGDKDVAVQVNAMQSQLTSNPVQIYSAATGNTVTTIASVRTGRGAVGLNTITIAESKAGTIRSGSGATFTIELPDNFRFTDSAGANLANRDLGQILDFVNFPTIPTSTAVVSSDRKTVTFTVGSVGRTTNITGAVYIRNNSLYVEAIDSDFYGDANLRIRDGVGDLNITDQTIKVASRVNFGVTLKATKSTDVVPTLVTGRVAADSTTKVLNFTIQENAASSWWTDRDTVITLPDGAKFAKVEIKETDKVSATDAATLKTAITATTFAGASANRDNGKAKIDGSKLTIKPFAKTGANDKVKLEIEAWVSVSQRIAGTDLELSVTGGGMDEDTRPAPLKVASVIAPITLAETAVSTIKIGTQAQPASNIVITETTAGALLTDKEVRLQMTDLYGAIDNDLVFNSNAKVTVTDGNIKLDNISTVAGGSYAGNLLGNNAGQSITFTIDTKSTRASTITISDVTVKASRVLPETDKAYYKVFVYGSAVAENFGSTNNGGNEKVNFDTLADAGVSTDYIAIAGSGENVGSTAKEFKYSIAEAATTYAVGGNTYPLADDMRGFNENGTVMIPLRLIAEGFGLVVSWNESNRTAVVSLSTVAKVEFPAGATFMKIAGTQIDMVDVNGKAVASKIVNDRIFIPFRQLGYALGINNSDMVWDQDTQTVTFNPGK